MRPCQILALILISLAPAKPDASAKIGGRIPILPPIPPIGATTLNEKIRQILSSSGLAKGQVSIQVVSLPNAKAVYELNPDLLLNPASNVKLVTAGAALKELGPDYTFKTEFYSNTLIKHGKIQNLWIKGFGDPLFITEELESVVNSLTTAGLKEIRGEVFVDDTYFDHYNLTTYLSDLNERTYSIVTGPLSFNFNSIEIRARPGRRLGDQPIISVEPATRFVKITNQARTGSRKGGLLLDAQVKETPVSHERKENEITIQGTIPRTIRQYSFRHGILDPATYTGTVIMEALEGKGVVLQGGLKREAVPPRALMLFAHSSPPLREILKGIGKFSNNFIAEQLLKTLGAARLGPPGSTEKGLKVLRDYLSSLKIKPDTYTLDNGSGLSRLTRLSSAQLIRVLLDLYASPSREDLISCLSVAGVDGTMKTKMRRSPLAGKVFAKTGTLNGVSALSGYLLDEQHPLAFSFLFNDFNASPRRVSRAEETILKTILASQEKTRGDL